MTRLSLDLDLIWDLICSHSLDQQPWPSLDQGLTCGHSLDQWPLPNLDLDLIGGCSQVQI